MNTLTINGITINCLYADLNEQQQALSPMEQDNILAYKKLQDSAVEKFFNDAGNLKKLAERNIISVDVDARAHLLQKNIAKNLVQMEMGLAFYSEKPFSVQNGIPIPQRKKNPHFKEVLKKVEQEIKDNIKKVNKKQKTKNKHK